MRKNESILQRQSVSWFRYAYPQYKLLLFSIPNGGSRNVIEAVRLKAEGVVAGVADMFLSIPRPKKLPEFYYGMFIEFKVGKNKLSEHQIAFKGVVEKHGYKHVTIYSFDEFKREIEFYIN